MNRAILIHVNMEHVTNRHKQVQNEHEEIDLLHGTKPVPTYVIIGYVISA